MKLLKSDGLDSPCNPSYGFEYPTPDFDRGMQDAEMDFIIILEDEAKDPKRAGFLKTSSWVGS